MPYRKVGHCIAHNYPLTECLKEKPNPMKEKALHKQICRYIDLQYSNAIYTSDASGLRLTMGLRVEQKAKTCKKYKVPDLIILYPNHGYHGLILEIKASYSDVYKKDGTLKKNEHIEDQAKSLLQLTKLGYKTEFTYSFDHAKNIIDSYFTDKK